jgi:ribosomal protein S18 acetylase RimI-like enzyme
MTEGSRGFESEAGGGEGDERGEAIVPLVPAAGNVVRALDPARDEAAAAILATCTFEGTVEAGRAILRAARADEASEVYGLTVRGDLVAVQILKKIPMSLEVTALAVAEGHRRQGHGRACLTDALRRAGKRPLVAESDEAGLPFYKAVGFKLVGRRTGPGGTPRYRLGWHAPTPKPRPTALQS